MARNTPNKPASERIRELLNYDAETGIFTRKELGRATNAERRYGKVGAGSISTHGYVMISIDGRNYNAGCVAWSYVHGEWPVGTIRYRNGVKTDNRIENLIMFNEEADQVKHRPLTLDRLKELLHYEPKTGWFTWRVASTMANVGERAGGHHGLGYRTIGIDYNKYLEHHLAFLYMTGVWPAYEVDHINNERDDNRWENLREVTRTDNNHNKSRTRTGRLGFTGVHPCGTRFRAVISYNRQEFHLGVFATIAEARVARLLAEIKCVGRITSFNVERDSEISLGDGYVVSLDVRDDQLYVMNEWLSWDLVQKVDDIMAFSKAEKEQFAKISGRYAAGERTKHGLLNPMLKLVKSDMREIAATNTNNEDGTMFNGPLGLGA